MAYSSHVTGILSKVNQNIKKIGLVVAQKKEVPVLFKNAAIIHPLHDQLIKIVVSGMGPKKAADAVNRLCAPSSKFIPDYFFNIGFCGATHDPLRIGDLVIADEVKNMFREKGYHPGKIQMSDFPVLSRKNIPNGVLAVDMESYAISKTSAKHGIPVVILKIVSDIVSPRLTAKNLFLQLKDRIRNRHVIQQQINDVSNHYFFSHLKKSATNR